MHLYSPVASVSLEINKATITDAPPSLTDEVSCFEFIPLFFPFPLFVYTTVYHFDAGSFYQLGFSICEARHQFEGMVMKLYYDH